MTKPSSKNILVCKSTKKYMMGPNKSTFHTPKRKKLYGSESNSSRRYIRRIERILRMDARDPGPEMCDSDLPCIDFDDTDFDDTDFAYTYTYDFDDTDFKN